MATRLKPLTIERLLSSLTQPSIEKLISWPHLTDMRDKVLAQDRIGVGLWGQLLVASGYITTDEYNQIGAALAETEEYTVPVEPLPATPMRSADGIPGSWSVVPVGEQFQLAWAGDNPPASLFNTRAEAAAFVEQFFAAHPPVGV
jgi:hypothetical protein